MTASSHFEFWDVNPLESVLTQNHGCKFFKNALLRKTPGAGVVWLVLNERTLKLTRGREGP